MNNQTKALAHNTWIIELLMALFLIAAIIIDETLKLSFSGYPIVVDIILVLLPSVITIVTIALAIPNDKILGITRIRFSRLRGPWAFGFLEMICITVVIFVFYTVFYALNYHLAIVVLEAESVIFAFYFSIQEIPLLTEDSRFLKRIIKRRYYARDTSYSFGSQSKENDLSTVLQTLVLTEGIKTAYFTLKTKDKKENSSVLYNLLDLQNDYLFSAVDDIAILKENPMVEYHGVVFSEAVEMVFSNINDLLVLGEDFDLTKIFGETNNIYLITRSIFSLQRLSSAMGLSIKEQKNFQGILFFLSSQLSAEGKHQKIVFDLLNTMICSSVPSEEMWFIELIRDATFPLQVLQPDEEPYGLFLLCYLYALCAYSTTSPSLKKKITVFLNEETKSVNGDGLSLLDRAKDQLDYTSSAFVASSLNSLLKIYESSDEQVFFLFHKERGLGFSCGESSFTKEDIFNDWIELMLFGNRLDCNAEALKGELDSLENDDKKIVADLLNKKWIKDGKPDLSVASGFLDFLHIPAPKNDTWHIDECAKVFYDFSNGYEYHSFKGDIEQNKKSQFELNAYKIRMGQGFDSAMAMYPLRDQTLDLSKSESLYCSFTIDNALIEQTVKMLVSNFNYVFGNILSEKLDGLETIVLSNEGLKYSNQTIEGVINFKPDFMSFSPILYDCSEAQKKALSSMSKLELAHFPRDIFWKKGAIAINASYDDKQSVIRSFTDGEVNELIDRDYTMINGLYKYLEDRNSGKSVLVTRDQLFYFLKMKYSVMILYFQCSVSINPKDILTVKNGDQKQ